MKKSKSRAWERFYLLRELEFFSQLRDLRSTLMGSLLVITLTLSISSCELFDSLGNRNKGLVGSEWSFVITKTHHYTISYLEIGWPCLSIEESSSCSNFGPSVTTYTGRFKVTDSEIGERGSNIYALELLENSIRIKFSHTNWRNNSSVCSSYRGEEDFTSFLSEFDGRYIHDKEDGDRFKLSWKNPDDGNFDFSFASDCTAEDFGVVNTWTEYYWPNHIYHRFEAEARDYINTYSEEDFFERTNISIKLSCVSDCEPEEDPCDEETIYNSCDDFRESVMEFCQTLDDWMVISTEGNNQEIICETADCSEAIDRNESEDPWVGITYYYNSQCSENENDIVCQVECFGWAEEDE